MSHQSLGVGREIPIKYFFGIALVVAAVMAGWEILAPEVTNIVFQDELHDMAAQAGAHIGLVVPPSDGVLRNLVIRKTEKHEVTLDPAQVTVRLSGAPENPVLYIAVDYTVPVNLVVYSFARRFHPRALAESFDTSGSLGPLRNRYGFRPMRLSRSR